MNIELLTNKISYDPDTGVFWRKSTNSEADYIDEYGYCRISMICHGKQRRYRAHRLAFLFMGEEIPIEVDHINGDKSDNRWVNLRGVSRVENLKNSARRLDNTSGFTGVYWNKNRNKWQASIRSNNKRVYLGIFSDLSEAVLVRLKAEVEHDFHINHGRN